MPRMPENGARIVLRSIAARISPTRASVCRLLGRRAVELGLRDDALVQQALHPLEVQRARDRAAPRRRPAAPAPAACRAATSTSPARTARARIERDALDDARQIGADRDALHRGHRADGAQRRRPLLLLRDDRRHRFGRRLERRALRHRGLDLLELHEAEAPRSSTPSRASITIIRFAISTSSRTPWSSRCGRRESYGNSRSTTRVIGAIGRGCESAKVSGCAGKRRGPRPSKCRTARCRPFGTLPMRRHRPAGDS